MTTQIGMWIVNIEIKGDETAIGFPYIEGDATTLMYKERTDATTVARMIAEGYAERCALSETPSQHDVTVVARRMQPVDKGFNEYLYSVIAGKYQGEFRNQVVEASVRRVS